MNSFFVAADEIVVRLSARCFFVRTRQKAQAILDVLPSIFDRFGGEIAAEKRA